MFSQGLSPNAEIFAGGTLRFQGDYRDGDNNYVQNTHNRVWTDTVKGTHGRGVEALPDGRVRLDFNYAYNPSCAYNSRAASPLAPRENHLAARVESGELTFPYAR